MGLRCLYQEVVLLKSSGVRNQLGNPVLVRKVRLITDQGGKVLERRVVGNKTEERSVEVT